MAFRFPLKALWRVRAVYERHEGRRLEALTRHLIYVQKQLSTLRKNRLARAESLEKSLLQGLSGAELQFQVVCSIMCEKRINAVAQVVESVSQQHQKQLVEYRRARQKLEVMERLYQRQLSAYRTTQTRRDHQEATDLFLICSQTANDGQ